MPYPANAPLRTQESHTDGRKQRDDIIAPRTIRRSSLPGARPPAILHIDLDSARFASSRRPRTNDCSQPSWR